MTDSVIENMLSGHHSGFQFYIGESIYKVVYTAKDRKSQGMRKNGRWWPLDAYIKKHSEADLTHTICLDCKDVYYGNL